MTNEPKLRGAAIAIAALLLAPVGALADAQRVGSIGLDEAVFWEGGHVEWSPAYSLPFSPSSSAIDRCAVTGPCFEYLLVVEDEGAVQLRVALDTPMRNDSFEWVLLDPTGAQKARITNSNHYTREALIADPVAGDWTIRVAPYGAEDAPFRMRAKLESEIHEPTPDADGYLLPNLRVFRIWEFGFASPVQNNGRFPSDDTNPQLEVAGFHLASCTPADDTPEEDAETCLRYSFGLANIGDGNFDVRWVNDSSGEPAYMSQCLERADGPPEPWGAGTGHQDTSHGHWHYDDIIFHQLFRVLDLETGAMEPSGDGKKIGYSPADQGMAEWHAFTQNPRGTSGSAGNCTENATRRLGMSRGWGDAYRFQRPGNYVEFGANRDGYYVVQTTVDPDDNVRETDETDNTAYAYLNIAFDELGRASIRILESGLGTSPWDPNKTEFDDWYEHPNESAAWAGP